MPNQVHQSGIAYRTATGKCLHMVGRTSEVPKGVTHFVTVDFPCEGGYPIIKGLGGVMEHIFDYGGEEIYTKNHKPNTSTKYKVALTDPKIANYLLKVRKPLGE